MAETTTCTICGGDGSLDGDLCTECFGQGSLPPIGIFCLIGKKLIDTQTKVDQIITEQASQREDLTAILTQIWNKVKDL